jgi:hypothetical protein
MHVQVIKDLLTYFYEIFEVQVEKNKTSKFEEAQEHNVKVWQEYLICLNYTWLVEI